MTRSGRYAQQRLQRWYATDEHRLDPGAVYLQSYTGQVATDSPLALHRRAAPEQARPAVALGGGRPPRPACLRVREPVLIRSREWYDALARGGHLVTNIDLERWFRRRPGQRLLQSFHGYPAKTMGIAAWEAKTSPRAAHRAAAGATSGTWDLLLTPDPAMDEHYRGSIATTARSSPLATRATTCWSAPTRRASVPRPGAGWASPTAEGAVLYAPTWRDDLATNFRAAAMSHHLDVDAAAADARRRTTWCCCAGTASTAAATGRAPRLLDVTDYPEINDLILAADAAVLDYSSLRFDFALTGRPTVFLVPDLDRYTGGVRGFLFDFAPTPRRARSSTPPRRSSPRCATSTRSARRTRPSCERFGAAFNARQDGHAAERVVASSSVQGRVTAPEPRAGPCVA